jgi:hypothetical protein
MSPAFLSSVMPDFVAKFISKKTKQLSMVLQMEIARQKKIFLLKYTDGFYSIGECELLKKYFCRSRRR